MYSILKRVNNDWDQPIDFENEFNPEIVYEEDELELVYE